MADPVIPLNVFKLLPSALEQGENVIYHETERNVTAIVLSGQITNLTNVTQVVSVQIERGGAPFALLQNGLIPPNDSLNPFAGKTVLKRGDKLQFVAGEEGALHAVLSILETADE